MLGPGPFSELLELLYSAASNATSWVDFLQQYSKVLGAESAGFIVQNWMDSSFAVAASFGIDPAIQRLYDQYYWQTDEWFKRSRKLIRPGPIFHGEELCSEAELLKSEFYNDYLKFSEMLFHEMGGVVAGAEGTIGVLTALRGRRRGAFEARDSQALKTLIPHIQRALAIHR
jgi:hypothetical protein